jgi:HPt (histidine-containing phosphotransfer) domain-containing protein
MDERHSGIQLASVTGADCMPSAVMSEPALQPEAIEALRAVAPDDGGQFLTELIDIFLRDTPLQIKALTNAVSAGDAAVALRAAHSIKGSAGNFGATAFARLAWECEMAAKAGALTEVASKLPALEQGFATVHVALTALRRP